MQLSYKTVAAGEFVVVVVIIMVSVDVVVSVGMQAG
jgi:hypothetical protein